MQSFLRVTNVVTKTAPNGRVYQTITFNQFTMIGSKEVKSRLTRTRNVWGIGSTKENESISADPYFQTLTTGDIVEGNVFTYNTTSYRVGDNTVSQWTGVIFSDEKDGVKYVNNQLKNQGACVIDEHGQMTKPSQVGATVSDDVVIAKVTAEEDF